MCVRQGSGKAANAKGRYRLVRAGITLVSYKNGVSIPAPLALAFSCGTKVSSERSGQGLKWNQKGLLWNHFGRGMKKSGDYLAR